MSWIASPGDIEQALARYGPLTDVWQVVAVTSSTQCTVALTQPNGVVPNLGAHLAAQYANALVYFVTGALSGVTATGTPGARFGTTVQSVSTTGSPAVTTLTVNDAFPTDPSPGDQLVVIRNVGINSLLSTVVESGNLTSIGSISGTVNTSGTISGTVNVNTVSGTVQVAGNLTNVSSLGSITETVKADSNVTNVVISGNNLVSWGSLSFSISLTSGSAVENSWDSANAGGTDQAVLADEIYIVLTDTAGNIPSLSLTEVPQIVYWPIGDFAYALNGIPDLDSAYGLTCYIYKMPLPKAMMCNGFTFIIKNTSTTTITEDIVVYAYVRYASAEVVNPTTNPANVLTPAFAFNPVNNGSINTGGTSQQMVGSNASRRRLVVTNTNTNGSGDTLWVQYTDTAGVNAGFPIAPGFGYEWPADQIPTNVINIYGATTGDTYSYEED